MRKQTSYYICFFAALVSMLLGCKNKSENKKTITEQPTKPKLIEVARSDLLWTGIAVSDKGRMFVNYPRWSNDIKISVAELDTHNTFTAYPDTFVNEWNFSLEPRDHFVCVQSVYIDNKDFLWILDSGNPNFKGVIQGGAKLIQVDIQTDKIIKKIVFDENITQTNSYLNDIRVDTELDYAYITDSGSAAIVVVNLATGESRRILSGHYSTKQELESINIEGREIRVNAAVDGLALDPQREYLYYQALMSRKMYRIKTTLLRDNLLSDTHLKDQVEFVGETGVSDGIEFGKDGYLYLTSLEYNAIRRFKPGEEIEVLVQSLHLKWPDSICITEDLVLYVTTSQIHLGTNRTDPYKLFKVELRP